MRTLDEIVYDKESKTWVRLSSLRAKLNPLISSDDLKYYEGYPYASILVRDSDGLRAGVLRLNVGSPTTLQVYRTPDDTEFWHTSAVAMSSGNVVLEDTGIVRQDDKFIFQKGTILALPFAMPSARYLAAKDKNSFVASTSGISNVLLVNLRDGKQWYLDMYSSDALDELYALRSDIINMTVRDDALLIHSSDALFNPFDFRDFDVHLETMRLGGIMVIRKETEIKLQFTKSETSGEIGYVDVPFRATGEVSNYYGARKLFVTNLHKFSGLDVIANNAMNDSRVIYLGDDCLGVVTFSWDAGFMLSSPIEVRVSENNHARLRIGRYSESYYSRISPTGTLIRFHGLPIQDGEYDLAFTYASDGLVFTDMRFNPRVEIDLTDVPDKDIKVHLHFGSYYSGQMFDTVKFSRLITFKYSQLDSGACRIVYKYALARFLRGIRIKRNEGTRLTLYCSTDAVKFRSFDDGETEELVREEFTLVPTDSELREFGEALNALTNSCTVAPSFEDALRSCFLYPNNLVSCRRLLGLDDESLAELNYFDTLYADYDTKKLDLRGVLDNDDRI